MPPKTFDLNANDTTRIWNLALAIYDGDDEDADLRNYFLQAMQLYYEFMDDAAAGGLEFDDGEVSYVSERVGDGLRFIPKKTEEAT